MKKLLIFLMILIPLVVIFIVNVTVDIVAGVVTISVDNVVLDHDSYIANINESFKLNAQIEPEGASDKTIIWSSSDENIATVDEEGNVIFHAFGAVDITATSGDGLKKDSCHINVTDTRVHDIEIYSDKTTLTLGESIHIRASVIPNTADNQEYVLRSSNEEVISINASGMATAKSVGNAIITATSLDGNYEASISLEVIVPVVSIDLIPEEEQITIGSSSILLSYNITPVNATNKKVIFSSSDPSTATVDASGRVNFIKTGDVIITATTENGNFTDSIKIVYTGGYPLSINLEQKEANFDISNGTLDMKINYTISPADTNILNVYFSSNNTSVATVNQNGLVQMIGGGTATISIKVQTGENAYIYDSVLINVKQNIKNISFPNKEIISASENVVLNPNLIPSDATERDNIAFEIISGDCATLTQNAITFNKVGSVVVKAYLKDNSNIYDEVNIIYTGGYPYSVEKVEDKIEIDAGENGSLNFILNPTGVSIREYTFKIVENLPIQTGKNVISLDETSGRFTALSGGKSVVRLYVKSGDNAEITVDYEIVVNKIAEDIEFEISEEIYNSVYITGNNVVDFVATALPLDSTQNEIIYTLSNNEIAKIIGNKIHFNQAGKIILTAKLKDNEQITKSVEIWYTGGYAISAKVVGMPTQFIANGSSFELSLTDIIPANASNKSFSVQLSNEQSSTSGNMLSVLYNSNSTTATVYQINAGSLTLSVVLAGSTSSVLTQNIEILQKVEKIEFITHAGETPNTQIELLCNVSPINASIKEVVFSLEEKYSQIAKIENNKLIFNSSVNEKETVVVLAKLTDVDGTIIESSIEITTTFGKISAPEGNEITLSPSNMVEYDYSAEILSGYKLAYKILSGNDLVSVNLIDNKIDINALKVGKASIEVQLIDENTNALFKILANLQITIAEKITDINIESKDLTFVNNKYYTGVSEFALNIILNPQNATLENVNVQISDENIATYNKETGEFKFLKAGIVVLTISSNDGSISKKFVIQNTNGSSISSEINLNSDNNLAINSEFEVKLLSFIPGNINLAISSITEITQSGSQNLLEISNTGNKFIIKGVVAGRTNIQVVLTDGTTKTFQITVVSSITNITFANTEITTSNKTITLNPILTPTNPSNKNLIFTSNNEEVATVDNFGVVKFLKKGSVIISVKSEENEEISATITLTSTFGEISDFTLNFSKLNLMAGEVRLLSVSSILPIDASRPNFKFEIIYMNSNNNSNLSVISLNNGSITALNGGIAIVKVYTTLESGEEIAKTCEITVERTLTSVDLELLSPLDTYQNYYVTSLEEIEFKLVSSPVDATISNSKIFVDNEEIAEIQGNKIVFKSEGLVKLTVQINSITKSLTLRHTKTPITFELDGVSGTVSNSIRTIELNAGEKLTLSAKNVIPSDIFDKSISLQLVVSTPNNLGDIVCQVNDNVISTIHGGSAKYKVIVSGKESNEILQIVVIQKGTQIEVAKDITTSKQVYSLNAKLLPADATNPMLTYSITSGNEFATIDGLGIITFKNEGQITVKIRNEFSNIETTSKITFSLGARTIEFDATPDFVFIGKTLQFSVIISPSTIVNEPVVWSVLRADGAPAGATISQSGLLTPSKFEETVVVSVALLNYPDVKASISIDIVAIITDINMDDDASNDKVGIAEEKVFGTHNISYTTVNGTETSVFTNTFQLGFNLVHNCATMPKLTYTSSNEQVAVISETGLVTVLAPGKTTISVYPQRQVSNDATKYILDSYTYTFVSGINLYTHKDFTKWAGLTNDQNNSTTAFKLGGVLQDTISFPSKSPTVDLCENKTLYGNGNLINLHNLGKINEADSRTITIASNTTFRNVQIRGYAFKENETILNLDKTYSCLMTKANSKNINLEYCLFENSQVNVRLHNSQVNLKGCVIANSYNGGVLCDSEDGNRTPNILNVDSCIFENNMLGCITTMTLNEDKSKTASIVNLNGFVDFYNWQPVSLLGEIDFGSLDDAFYRVIESLIKEKLSTILSNYGYMFKTYNNEQYLHMGIIFMDCNVTFEGMGIVLHNNGQANFNTTNNPYALQTIKEPIAIGSLTFYDYGLSGTSNNSIQPGTSYKDNIKAAYDKIRRYTQG